MFRIQPREFLLFTSYSLHIHFSFNMKVQYEMYAWFTHKMGDFRWSPAVPKCEHKPKPLYFIQEIWFVFSFILFQICISNNNETWQLQMLSTLKIAAFTMSSINFLDCFIVLCSIKNIHHDYFYFTMWRRKGIHIKFHESENGTRWWEKELSNEK